LMGNINFMPDQTKPNLEPIDENDLNLKEKFIGGAGIKKTALEKPEALPEKELTQAIEKRLEEKENSAEREAVYYKILSGITTKKPAVPGAADVSADAEAANRGMDAESKINNLIELAEIKGIPHAVKVARHMEDNYTLDEFHDRLLGEELHSALVKKGLIKEI